MASILVLWNNASIVVVMDRLPTLQEISPTQGSDLDEKAALDAFLDKSQKEAIRLFAQNDEYYPDLLVHMGRAGFQYYFKAYVKYLKSAPKMTSASIYSLWHIINIVAIQDPKTLSPLKFDLLTLIRSILANWDGIEANEAIYKNLHIKLCQALQRIESLR